MKSFISVCNAFINLIYPPVCLHCKESVLNTEILLCPACLQLLQLIDPLERCPRCFSIDFSPDNQLCFDCFKKPPLLNGMAAAFDYLGPASTLIKKLKYGDLAYLSKGCGGYLAAQFLQMDWPFPDVIIPMPISLSHLMERGFNQSLLLAQSLSRLLNCPVEESLMRDNGDYSQAGLSRSQRQLLDGSAFYLKSHIDYSGKTLLLVDDVMTTGMSLRRCGEILMETNPAQIYALTLCKAIK